MPNILVVDDAAVDRRLVGELLQKRIECNVQYAANGVEALAQMEDAAPDLVVTDLQMPVMDGLQLVTKVRRHHPGVPVILITAHGSETLAVEALEQGAACYVPKAKVAEKLSSTVDEVLRLAHAASSHEQLLGCLDRTEFSFSLSNDPALIDPLVKLVEQMVTGMELCDFAGRLQIGVALKEALLNALFHGNLELSRKEMEAVEHRLIQESDVSLAEERGAERPYCDRKVFVEAKLSSDQMQFRIRDEGPGFDPSTVPDPSDPAALGPDRGRGLSLIRAFMDEVKYNEKGNEVTMIKRRK